ncbi:MAG: M48 family metallopeptidase, partial [Gammaproteobacteria bacterium]|nr:M48 family metallopeptidase [Gammaproteobacteria bacterium]
MVATQVAAQNDLKLPELGSAAASSLTIEKEQRIGTAYMMMVRSQLPIVNDPLLEGYIQDIGHKLVANANDVKTDFNFFLVNNKAINAFAFFGGYVGIHTSLLELADTESELASVISHEITHVTQRHLARSIEARSKSQPATIAAIIASLALAVAGAPQAGMAGLQTSMAISQQLSINYTRSNEREADRIGIDLMAKSQFDPQGAPQFFSKMAAQSRFSKKLPPMLLTHPVTEQRIADTRMRAAEYPRSNIPLQKNFQLAKARIMARFSGLEPQAIQAKLARKFSAQDSISRSAFQYGNALVLLAMDQPLAAKETIDRLRQTDPNNLFYLDTLTDIYLALKQPQQAVTLLNKYNDLMPNNSVISLNFANALLAINDSKKAVYILEQFLSEKPNNVSAWGILKDAQGKSGN